MNRSIEDYKTLCPFWVQVSQKQFTSKIDEIISNTREGIQFFSPCISNYSLFQIALVLENHFLTRQICQMSQNGECFESKSSSVPPYLIACSLRNIEVLERIYQSLPPLKKMALLYDLQIRGYDEFKEILWEKTSPTDQSSMLITSEKFLDFADDLFDSLDERTQGNILISYLLNDETTHFCRLFSKVSSFLVRGGRNNEFPWFSVAIQKRNPTAISVLINRKASIFMLDNKGRTPLQLMQARGEFSESLIEKMEEYDNGFTQGIMACKLLGLCHGFRGNLYNGLEVTKIHLVVENMIETIQEISSYSTSHLLISSSIIEAFQTCLLDNETVFNQIKRKWGIIACGWKGHRTVCILSRKICIKIDTGTRLEPGLQFYRIGEEDDLLFREAIFCLQSNKEQMVSKRKGKNFFTNGLNNLLNLKKITSVFYLQTARNCTVFAFQGALLGLMILELLERENLPVTHANVQRIVQKAKVNFAIYEDKNSSRLLEQSLPIIERQPNIFNHKVIYERMIEYCLENRLGESLQTMVKILPQLRNWQNGEYGESLLQKVLLENDYCLFDIHFIDLCNMGCNLSLVDFDELNLVQDIQLSDQLPEEYEQWLSVYEDSGQSLEYVIDTLEKTGLLSCLVNYQKPVSGVSLGRMALEQKCFRFFAILCRLDFQVASEDLNCYKIELNEDERRDFVHYLTLSGISENNEKANLFLM